MNLPASSWVILTTAIPPLVWQVVAAIRDDELSTYRLIMLLLCMAVLTVSILWRRRSEWRLTTRLLLAMIGAALFWLSALELLLGYTTILALGLLLVVAAALSHATLLVVVTRPAADDSAAARVISRLGFSLSLLVLLLCGMEVVLRMIFPLTLYGITPDDPNNGPVLVRHADGRTKARPGTRGEYHHPEFPGCRVEINAYGLRDGLDEARPPRKDEQSVLVLGDSFAFGLGVQLEETFHERLERLGEEISDRPVRVYGGGMPGYGPLDQYKMLKDLAPRTRPDVVIVAFFEGNDFTDNWSNAKRLDLGPATKRTGKVQVSAASRPADDQGDSAIYWFWQKAKSPRFWTDSNVAVPRMRHSMVRLGVIDPVVYSSKFLEICFLNDPPALLTQLRDHTIGQLRAIRTLCEQLQAELVILVIPSAVQAISARFERYLDSMVLAGGAGFTRTGFHQDFVGRLEQDGFTIVDMLPNLESEATAGRDPYHGEGHWNAHGHSLAAEHLAPVLARIFKGQALTPTLAEKE